jgi:hypothetical protein
MHTPTRRVLDPARFSLLPVWRRVGALPSGVEPWPKRPRKWAVRLARHSARRASSFDPEIEAGRLGATLAVWLVFYLIAIIGSLTETKRAAVTQPTVTAQGATPASINPR